jgi:hypothetical protein
MLTLHDCVVLDLDDASNMAQRCWYLIGGYELLDKLE